MSYEGSAPAEIVAAYEAADLHEAGCFRGGFSCQYWVLSEGCRETHWEQHYVRDGRCACGDEFPNAPDGAILVDATG